MHFDETHYYDKNNLKPQKFADDKWHQENDEFFANFTNILDTSNSISKFNTILWKSSKTYLYSNQFHGSLFFRIF